MARRAAPASTTSVGLCLVRALLGPDPPLTPTLQAIVTQALELLKQTKRNLFGLGTLYASLVAGKALEGTKFQGAQDFWIRNIPIDDVSVRTVQLWSRLAVTWGRDICAKYSAQCLDLLIRYCAAKGLKIQPDPGSQSIGFADKDGYHVEKAFSKCTEADMRLAVYGAPEPAQLPEQEQEIFDEVHKIVMGAVVGDHRTRLTGKMDGLELVFDLMASRSLLPFIVEALHEWALERTGAMPAPNAQTERKAKTRKPRKKRR